MLAPYMHNGIAEAGCDEAGRGCLCGPVACAAVILPPDFNCPELNDSKQLSEAQRDALRPLIEAEALAWSVVFVSAAEIDRINILQASITGMHRALDSLHWNKSLPSPFYPPAGISGLQSHRSNEITAGHRAIPAHILVDGNRFRPYSPSSYCSDPILQQYIPHTTVVHGDAKYASIAAASILAKTHRDEYMKRLAADFPGYGWETNMGYPTSRHRRAIASLGTTPHHRLSFKLL